MLTGGSGTSNLQVATSNVSPGSYPLTVTATSGTLTHTANVSLVVSAPTPDFSLSANPATQAIASSGTGSYGLSVAAQNGFTGNVSLAVAGLPTGVNASFTPASISGGREILLYSSMQRMRVLALIRSVLQLPAAV
jgi:uncharacterized membrane protein